MNNDEQDKRQETPHTLVEKILKEGFKDGWKDRVKNAVSELKLPKEAIAYILKQVDETKEAALHIVSKEVKDYLEKLKLSEEISKALSNHTLEITTTIKFKEDKIENDDIKIKIKKE